jgi:hypothetical protein
MKEGKGMFLLNIGKVITKVFFDPKTCKWRIAYLTYYDNPA